MQSQQNAERGATCGFDTAQTAGGPEEFGEQTRVYGKDVVTINRQERFHWDQDILEELFKSGKLPAHIKKRLTVEKRTFQKLTEAEQKELQPALTRKPGPISVKLTRSS